MAETLTVSKTGGVFVLESVGAYPIFTREQFTEEQREIEQLVTKFCTENIFPVRDQIEGNDTPLIIDLLKQMGELGLLSLHIPEKLGGMEMDKTTGLLVAEALSSSGSSAFTVTQGTQTGIGMLPIVWFGTEEQKAKYLPKLATAEWISAYALTEPSAGSDATSSKTTAILSDDGKHYVLNGEKQFITNGGIADVYSLFCQIDGTKFSAFIVERTMEGFEVGPEEHKMGSKGSSTTPLKLTNVKVPVENLLGKVGGGATIAFNVLNHGRLKLGAHVLGGCKQVITNSANYALERRQFGQPIAYFDAIKKKIADMTIRTYALDSIIYRTAGLIDAAISELDHDSEDYYLKMGEVMERFAIEASMAKVLGSETLGFCADTGIQIYGGYGYIEEYPMARLYRDTRIDRIWEGTNEINRQIITGYFMKKALMDEIPIRDKIRAIDDFLASDEFRAPGSALSRQIQIVEAGKYMVLYLFNEAMNEFGQDLKHEQQLGELLADSFMDLYLADSTLARVGQMIQSNGQHGVLVPIAQALTAEATLNLMNRGLIGLNDIFHGNLPHEVTNKLRLFQVRLLPKADVASLKRQIAEYVYSQKRYPF